MRLQELEIASMSLALSKNGSGSCEGMNFNQFSELEPSHGRQLSQGIPTQISSSNVLIRVMSDSKWTALLHLKL